MLSRLHLSILLALSVIFAGASCSNELKDDEQQRPNGADSGSTSCGDGICGSTENSSSCPLDCMEETTELCTDTCEYAGDGECDDGGPNAQFDACELGSDCSDCGPREANGSCDNADDGVCPSASCTGDPDCICTPDCASRTCGSDGCTGTCGPGCQSDQVCEVGATSSQCVEDTSNVSVGATCSACDNSTPGLRCLAPNQQDECGGDPFSGGNGWCNKGVFDSSGYCTKTCNDNSDCPAAYPCIDASGGRFCLSS